jgi:tetratricopeptide (TPR) repeat protein
MYFFIVIFIFITSGIYAQDIPEEARKHLSRGQAAVEIAKTNADFEEALSEFSKAVELAPEWSEAYYQLGVLQDKLERYDDAYSNLKRCLELDPNAGNTAQVQDLIYKIEFKRDKADKKKEIIDILTSSYYIITKGERSPGLVCNFKKFSQVNDEITAFIACINSDFNQTVPVEFNGSVLKFNYVYYGCPNAPEVKNYPCEHKVSIVADVISTSPLRLKVKEVCTRKSGSVDSYESEWEFK